MFKAVLILPNASPYYHAYNLPESARKAGEGEAAKIYEIREGGEWLRMFKVICSTQS